MSPPSAPVDVADGLPPTPRPSVITRPIWISRPTGSDIASVYPRDALRHGVSGRATLVCGVTLDGGLIGCSALDESPPDYGFGAAVVRLARKFRMKPTTLDGQSVEGAIVQIPISLRAPN